MTIVERTSVAVFGLLLACIFGVLLAWMVMAVAVETDDKSKTGTSAEKIEILRVRRFMLIGGRGTDEREGYWTDPESGEQVKVLESHPVPIPPVMTPDRFMLIGQDDHLSQRP